MAGYYAEKLAAERLERVYALASPPVTRYLEGEIRFVASRLRPQEALLELGCGYGRVLAPLLPRPGTTWGIDSSRASIGAARRHLHGRGQIALAVMDAVALAFPSGCFDLVACVQNGISAFGVDRQQLVREALRVTRPGGRALFSSYADHFWPERLAWFRAQAAAGLIGPIDEAATRRGTIVCRDGFRATTVSPAEFRALGAALGLEPHLQEVCESSLCCEFRKE